MWQRIIILSLLSLNLYAIPEENYQKNLKELVLPFYEQAIAKSFKAHDGIKIHFKYLGQNSTKAMVILAGRTEPVDKYQELVYDLRNLGYDYYLMDTRGQGHSDPLLQDPEKGHVEKYQDYISDLHKLYQTEVAPRNYEEVVFLGHSMGGGIGLHYAEIYPKHFHKIITAAPMLEILFKQGKEPVIMAYIRLLRLLGKSNHYSPGGGNYLNDLLPFKDNYVTHSQARYQMGLELVQKNPHFKLGSPTNNWAIEAIKMTRKTFKERKKLHKTPMLMFQAGIEHYSLDNRQNTLCKEHPNCKLVRYQKAKHEILQEKDQTRDSALSHIKDFLSN